MHAGISCKPVLASRLQGGSEQKSIRYRKQMQKANARMVDDRVGKRRRVGGGMVDHRVGKRLKGGGESKYLGSGQLEGPQEVGCLLKSWSNCVDLVDKVLDADDVVLA